MLMRLERKKKSWTKRTAVEQRINKEENEEKPQEGVYKNFAIIKSLDL